MVTAGDSSVIVIQTPAFQRLPKSSDEPFAATACSHLPLARTFLDRGVLSPLVTPLPLSAVVPLGVFPLLSSLLLIGLLPLPFVLWLPFRSLADSTFLIPSLPLGRWLLPGLLRLARLLAGLTWTDDGSPELLLRSLDRIALGELRKVAGDVLGAGLLAATASARRPEAVA